MLLLLAAAAQAQALGGDPAALITEVVGGDNPVGVHTSVRLILFLTGLSFLPAMVVVMTPFVRFIVVLSLLRQALGLNQSPPNQVIVGFSLFLTLLVMQPVFSAAWEGGLAPFLDGATETGPALTATLEPMRDFMLANTRKAEMAVIMDVANLERPDTLEQIPTPVVVSAYILSELHTSFVVSVYMFVPFLVVDMIISSILLGLGMMMLPPTVVSLPFKLLVFVLMDGWSLLVRDLVAGIVR